jgi:Protein of unknown function (DUF2934)
MGLMNTTHNPIKVSDAEIGMLAYQMWEEAGHPRGQDQKFWFEAETQLRAIANAAPAMPAAKPSPVDLKQKPLQKDGNGQTAISRSIASTAQQKPLRAPVPLAR